MESEAGEVVTLKKGGEVEDTTSQVSYVKTSEGVDPPSVTPNAEELRVLLGCSKEIGQEEGDGVLVTNCALVPVLRNAFVTLGPLEVAAVTGDGEEGLENLLVEDSLGVLSGLVGHEAVDEGVGCGLHDNAGEWSIEEERVFSNRLVESGRAKGSEDRQIVVGGRWVWLKVEQLLELADDDLVGVTTTVVSELRCRTVLWGGRLLLVKIWASWTGVALILVVRTRDTSRCTEQAENPGHIYCWTSN